MSTLRIVPFAEDHVAPLATLEAQCFSDPWSENALREELKNPCAHFLVALYGESVAGYLGCHHVAGEGFVTNIAVFPAYRRLGIARALITAAVSEPISRLALEVRASNDAAIALYRSLGFTEDGIRPRFYAHPTEDAILFSRSCTE
jgi:ribosomal-protein-alanine N-acetyltransferase